MPLTLGSKLVVSSRESLSPEAVFTLEPTGEDLVHVEDTYGVHASVAVDAADHRLLVNGVVFHLFEDVLRNDGGREWVISDGHLVRGDLTEATWTVDVSREREVKT